MHILTGSSLSANVIVKWLSLVYLVTIQHEFRSGLCVLCAFIVSTLISIRFSHFFICINEPISNQPSVNCLAIDTYSTRKSFVSQLCSCWCSSAAFATISGDDIMRRNSVKRTKIVLFFILFYFWFWLRTKLVYLEEVVNILKELITLKKTHLTSMSKLGAHPKPLHVNL